MAPKVVQGVGQMRGGCHLPFPRAPFLEIVPRREIGYLTGMKAVVTEGFLESIPDPIRTRLHLASGMVMDFDETTPYLKATAVTDEDSPKMTDAEFDEWLAASVGIAKGMPSTDEMMRETRGED